ncbi:MAG: ribonuclease III [Alphaproteobacteria bacterium]|nr:ribonuclease III [Alphaproteobacteria bacterium]
MSATPSLSGLEQAIGYSFRDKNLLRIALTHSSAASEENYERLEFLGDRVLGLVIAALIFEKFPNETEGDLARRLASLVQGSMLAELSESINLGEYIILSDAERESGGSKNENILADVYEALIGAMYLDGGFEPCQTLITKKWADVLHTMKTPPQHPKTALQEWAQSLGIPLPAYEITGQTGPDHAPVFEITLRVKDHGEVTASGRSRQEAEKQAASLFLEKIKKQ